MLIHILLPWARRAAAPDLPSSFFIALSVQKLHSEKLVQIIGMMLIWVMQVQLTAWTQ
jgi:hypothetical protein